MTSKLVDPYLEKIAEDFWTKTGVPLIRPRDMENAIALTLPLGVVVLPRMSLSCVEDWLDRRGVPYRFPCEDRSVHGCLVAHRGLGLIFVDGTDPAAERRFTLAHEASHFLLNYHLPRQTARQRLGDSILDVLDGLRPPTIEENVDGLLARVSVRPHMHLLERQGTGTFTRVDVWYAENQSDQLSLEILAPFKEVSRKLKSADQAQSYPVCLAAACQLLTGEFDLPEAIAHGYAVRIAEVLAGGPSALAALGID